MLLCLEKKVKETGSLLCHVHTGKKKKICSTLSLSMQQWLLPAKNTVPDMSDYVLKLIGIFLNTFLDFRLAGLYISVIDLILHFGFCSILNYSFFSLLVQDFIDRWSALNQFLPHFLTSFTHHLAMFCTQISLNSPLQFSPVSCVYSCCPNILQFSSVFNVLRQNAGMLQKLK